MNIFGVFTFRDCFEDNLIKSVVIDLWTRYSITIKPVMQVYDNIAKLIVLKVCIAINVCIPQCHSIFRLISICWQFCVSFLRYTSICKLDSFVSDVLDLCPEDVDNFHTQWGHTKFNTSVIIPCTGGSIGNVLRYCDVDRQWQEPDYSGCISVQIYLLKEQVR